MKISVSTDHVHFQPVEVTTLAALADIAQVKNYSPGVFKDDHRRLANFIQAECIALDIDNDGKEHFTIEQAKDLFTDYQHVIMPSKSHRQPKGRGGKIRDRFRVVLKLANPITDSRDFKATWFELKKFCPHIDDACKDSSRFFYPSPGVFSIQETGKLWPVTQFVAPEMPKAEASLDSALGRGDLSKDTLRFLIEGAPEGQRNKSLFKAAKDMQEQGYTKDEVIVKLQAMIDSGGSWATAYVNDKDRECIDNAFNQDPMYEPRKGGTRPSIFNFQRINELIAEAGEVEWLVDNLVTQGGLGLMVGPPKAGKSTLVRQLVKAVAQGDTFLGRNVITGPVLYLTFEEQPAVLKQQFEAVGITDKDPIIMHVGTVFAEPELVFTDIEAAIMEFNPRLVVLDTLFDIIQVESINDYGDVKMALARLRTLARNGNCHILGVHHTNKAGEGNNSIMGSNAIHGAVDVLVRFVQEHERRYIYTNGKHGVHFIDQEIVFEPVTQTYTLGVSKKRGETL